MTNPCKQCIVDPMCKEGCDLLERYLYHLISPIEVKSTYFRQATRIRQEKTSIRHYEETSKNESM